MEFGALRLLPESFFVFARLQGNISGRSDLLVVAVAAEVKI